MGMVYGYGLLNIQLNIFIAGVAIILKFELN